MRQASLTSRIVGAIVLLSLGIIFIPVFLETNKIDGGRMDKSPIPDVPSEISTIVFQLNDETGEFEEQGKSPAVVFEEQVSREILNSANEVELLEPQAESTPQAKTPTKAQTSTHSWMLQVASFKDRQKALELRDKLRAQRYVTHVEERKQGSGSVWRVRIGPDLNKSNIQKIQATLDQEMGLRGLIIRRR